MKDLAFRHFQTRPKDAAHPLGKSIRSTSHRRGSLLTISLIHFLPGATAYMLCIYVEVCAVGGSIFGELKTLGCVRLGQEVYPLHHDPDLWKISSLRVPPPTPVGKVLTNHIENPDLKLETKFKKPIHVLSSFKQFLHEKAGEET